MNIKLRESTVWGLVNPLDSGDILLWLTPAEPSKEVDYQKLPEWAKHLLSNSVKRRYISVDGEIEDFDNTQKVQARKPSKVTKKKTRRKKVSKRTTSRRKKQ